MNPTISDPTYRRLLDISHDAWGCPTYGDIGAEIVRGGLADRETGLTAHVTAGNVQELVRRRNYESHTLNGSLGKALDTLLYAAGVIPEGIDPTQAEHDDDFITIKALRELALQQGLSYSRISNMSRRVSDIMYRQIKNGSPAPDGEVVVEGSVKFHHRLRTNNPESIAVSSLAHVASSYRGGQSLQTTQFLERASEMLSV